MPRALSLKSTADVLKQDAKRWLAQLRRQDPEARRRLDTAWPDAPAAPVLRDVQHALACEYGFRDWVALLAALDDLAIDRQTHEQRVDIVLRHGWQGDRTLAARILARHPDLAHETLYTAVTCGAVATVSELLTRDASLAARPGGPHHWPPLLYVCYGRLDAEHAVTIATQLLDAGADPNASFDDGWGNPFTGITGAIGLGEGVKPTHPQAEALVTLLLDRGADPFDTQALYNDSIAHDDVRWLARLWDACARAGRTDDWHRTDGRALGGRFKVGTLNYLLGNAVTNRHVRRATWLLEHGASAATRHSYSGDPVHTVARLAGFTALTALLEAHGAVASPLSSAQAFAAAVMANDEAAVRAMVAADPTLVARAPLGDVAGHGHLAGVQLLLDVGADVNRRDGDGATPLHRAAFADAADVVTLLLSHGADVDAREPRWQATPLGWAVHLGRDRAADVLTPLSRDVYPLARSGRVARLAEVLRAIEPSALTSRGGAEPTPLFTLPDEDETAATIARLLIEAGVDRTVRDTTGRTAAEVARLRGLDEAAGVIAPA